jgi:hypothetical protein
MFFGLDVSRLEPMQVVHLGFVMSSALYMVANIYYWIRARMSNPVTGDYAGDYNLAGQYHGQGQLKISTGDSYTGQFYNGQFQGRGEYSFASGVTIAGRFVRGLVTGAGSETYPSGAWFRGCFDGSRREGAGTLSGDAASRWVVSTCAFRRGRRDGAGVEWLRDGSRRECSFVEGRLHGPALLHLPSGAVVNERWDHGRRLDDGTATATGAAAQF